MYIRQSCRVVPTLIWRIVIARAVARSNPALQHCDFIHLISNILQSCYMRDETLDCFLPRFLAVAMTSKYD
jgi:hypothetical protein